MRREIVQQAHQAFGADLQRLPEITLRGGCAIDSYKQPPQYDAKQDEPTDAYLEQYTFWGLGYLDAASWRHYLPQLIAYTFRHPHAPHTLVLEGLLCSLRPPDHEPPRLATLTAEQEAVIVRFLEELAFNDDSDAYQELALQILEEWWLPNARYRTRSEQAP